MVTSSITTIIEVEGTILRSDQEIENLRLKLKIQKLALQTKIKKKKRTEEEKYILTFSFQKLLHLKCIYQPLAVTQKANT